MSVPDRIKISKEFHAMGSGLWLSIEMPIAPGENEIEEFKKGDATLTKAFSAIATPSAEYSSDEGMHGTKNGVYPEEERIAILIRDIGECSVIDEKNPFGVQTGLLGYERLASEFPIVKEAYDKRLKELS